MAGPAVKPAAPASPFKLYWDRKTGRGPVIQVIPGDGTYRLCLSCKYPGYTGGLWVGSQSGSGFAWVPEQPIAEFPSLNLFCAQDETIYEPARQVEYEPGWSQNFGRGDDGVSLSYVSGEVLSDGSSGGGLVLSSENAAGCYRESRYLYWPTGRPFVVIALHLENTCREAVDFQFWTGEDPWIGRYATSEGDVGWTPAGIVRTETVLDASVFSVAGFYDLGNELLGEQAAPFSNVANFIALDPSAPKPTHALFANRFAHSPAEVDPAKPLDNKTMTALNLGWTGLSLAPGKELRIAYALGRAGTGRPGELPVAPAIDAVTWGFDRALHRAASGAWSHKRSSGNSLAPLQFRDEIIHVSVDPPQMTVDALYTFENRAEHAVNAGLYYPFPLGDELDYPAGIKVEGVRFKKTPTGLMWRLKAGPNERVTVEVRYTQRCRARLARYILTSTAFWNQPLESGKYRVDWPSGLEGVSVSYPGRRSAAQGREILEWEASGFLPKKDLVVTW